MSTRSSFPPPQRDRWRHLWLSQLVRVLLVPGMLWTQKPSTPFNRAISAPEVTRPRFEKDSFKSPGSFFVSPHLGSIGDTGRSFLYNNNKKMDPLIGKTHWVSPQRIIWHHSTALVYRKNTLEGRIRSGPHDVDTARALSLRAPVTARCI